MSPASVRELMQVVVEHYLGSHDFNGIALESLLKRFSDANIELVQRLVASEKLEIASESWDMPFIKRLDTPGIKLQLEELGGGKTAGICVYPTRKHMRGVIPRSRYRSRPFVRGNVAHQ